MGVACSCFDLENTIVNLQKRNIKCSSTQIKNKHISFALFFLVKSISNSGSSWLINDSQHVKARNCSSILSGLSLGVIEISWNSDYCILDFLTNVGLGDFLHFCQDHWGNLFRVEFFVFALVFNHNDWFSLLSLFDFEGPMFHVRLDDRIIEFSTDESFSIEDGVIWVFGCLIFGSISDESFSLGEGHIWRSGPVTLVVGYNLDSVILPDSYTGVGGTEIDSNSFWSVAHLVLLFYDYRGKSDKFIGRKCSSIF